MKKSLGELYAYTLPSLPPSDWKLSESLEIIQKHSISVFNVNSKCISDCIYFSRKIEKREKKSTQEWIDFKRNMDSILTRVDFFNLEENIIN